MSVTREIFDRLNLTGVSWWDASDKRVYDISENFRDFLGLNSCHVTQEELKPYVNPDVIEACHRKVGCGEEAWTTVFRVDGREHRLRLVRISEYTDANGSHHVIGTISPIKEEEQQQQESPQLTESMERLNIGLFNTFRKAVADPVDNGQNEYPVLNEESVFDQISDLLRNFRTHFPPGVMVSAWENTPNTKEFRCVALSGQFPIPDAKFSVKVATVVTSDMFADVMTKNSVVLLRANDEAFKLWPRAMRSNSDAGFDTIMYYRVMNPKTGKPWGVLSCGSVFRRQWIMEDRQLFMLLADAIMVLFAQSVTAGKLKQQLLLTRMACLAGKCFTWQWDVINHQRYVLTSDGKTVLAPYDLMTHRADFKTYSDAYCDIIERKTDTFQIEIRMRTVTDDAMRWYSVSAQAVAFDPNGKVQLIVGVAKDIDDRIKRENEKKREIEFQNMVYNRLPAIISFYDKNGKQVFVNDRCVQTFGLRHKEDYENVNLFESPNLTDEQKLTIRMQDNCSFNILYDFGKVSKANYYRTMRSDVIDVSIRVSKLFSHGNMTGYMVVSVDSSIVTVQRRRLQLFNNFFAEIGRFGKLGICQFGQGGFASAQWNLNLALPANHANNALSLVCPAMMPSDLAFVNAQLIRIVNGEIRAFQREVRVIQADGTHYVNLHFLYSDAVKAVTAISLDITERREREQALIRSLRKSERVENLRMRFFDNVSHELRTPLNAIVGFSEMLADKQQNDPELKRYADIIKSNNATLISLMDGIMELAQIQTGNRHCDSRLTNIDNLLTSVHDRMMDQVPHNVQFLCSHEPKLQSLMVSMDRVAVEQILCKLLSNAFQFTERGCVMLWADVHGNSLFFHVSDTGCGIEQDKLDTIFEVFVKLNAFNKGAGLGLSICEGLAHLMGGSIGVESTPGRGSHCWLKMPFLADKISPDSLTHNSQLCDVYTSDEQDLDDEPINECRNVMVLTSDTNLSVQISLMLVHSNVFRSEREGITKVWMLNRPQLSVIDVRACADIAVNIVTNIHALDPASPILTINADSTGVADHDLLQAGAVEVIRTPFSVRLLADTLTGLVRCPLKMPECGTILIQ